MVDSIYSAKSEKPFSEKTIPMQIMIMAMTIMLRTAAAQ